MKKRLLIILAVVLTLTLFVTACGPGAEDPGKSEAPTAEQSEPKQTDSQPSESEAKELDIPVQQLAVGTASSGGAFYPIGTGIAEIITRNIEPLTATAEITGGSVENPRLAGDGDIDLGIANANHVSDAIDGVGAYDAPSDLKVISALHPAILHMVTLEKTGIESVEDLKGKRVAVGPAGGGSIDYITAVLEEYGMSFDDITPSYVSYDDGMTQLKDGQVSVTLVGAGFPAAAVMALGATDKIKLIPIGAEQMDNIVNKYAYYSRVDLPSSVYNTESDVISLGVHNLLFCVADLTDDTVYAITKAMYENLEEFKTYHNSLAGLKQDEMNHTNLPLHPGAERFYKEVGLMP